MHAILNRSSDHSHEDRASSFEVRVLGGFAFVEADTRIALPVGSQRLLAYLALTGRVRRAAAAAALWPVVSQPRAHANLRAALARLGAGASVVAVDAVEISLADGVWVDLRHAETLARRQLATRDPDAATAAIPWLSSDLLPGWYEDWVVLPAENWRQLRLHALEAAAEVLAGARRWAEAIGAAEAAVDADPLRESARAALIRVHLAEGNQSEALREFERYRRLLRAELRLEPTDGLRRLLPCAHS